MSSPSTPRLSCPGPRIRSRRLHSRPTLTISRPCCAAGRGFADPVCPPAAPVFGSDGCSVAPRLEVVRAHSPPSFGAFGLRPPGRRSEEAQGSAHLGWEAFRRWRPGLQVWGWCSAAPYWPHAALDTDGRPCPKPSVAGGTTLSTINPRSTHLANETKGLMRPEKWNPQAGYLVFCMNS